MNAIIERIIEPSDKFTFLVGAGISMDTPSNVPSAKNFVESEKLNILEAWVFLIIVIREMVKRRLIY
ncbi:MAG: hypothetical protein ACFFC3_00125 [Candidatus Odinarchaeota archaeon]